MKNPIFQTSTERSACYYPDFWRLDLGAWAKTFLDFISLKNPKIETLKYTIKQEENITFFSYFS